VSLLRLQNISLFSQESRRRLLGPLTFNIEPGAWLNLEAEEGGGKTLLLRFLSGAARDVFAEGQIFWRDQNLLDQRNRSSLRDEIFYLPEEPRVFSALSVSQNLFVSDGPALLPLKALTLEAEKLLARAPFKFSLQESCAHLSALECLQIELGRMLLKRRSLILVDEIALALTQDQKRLVREFLLELQSQGCAIIDANRFCKEAPALDLQPTKSIGLLQGRRPMTTLQRREIRIRLEDSESDFVVRAGEILGVVGGKPGQRRHLWNQLVRSKQQGKKKPRLSFVSGFRTSTGLISARSSHFNLMFPQPSRNKKTRHLFEHYRDVLRFENADPRTLVESLSNDDRQKLLLARALKEKPEVLLCEEITRGLQPQTRQYLAQSLRQLADSEVTVVLFCANHLEIRDFCDRFLTFKNDGQRIEKSFIDSHAEEEWL
jgi:putative ABC transport system ATP-binding protein